ncbi:MAG: HEPN domain-containing protein [Acidobacteriota bacterium]
MEEAKAWLDKAEQDLDTANFNLESGKPPYAAFLYQQAVEKALKYAVLQTRRELPKIHDCFVLAKQAGASEKIAAQCDLLTPYYFRTRYPDVGEDVTIAEAEDLRRAAEEILEWV